MNKIILLIFILLFSIAAAAQWNPDTLVRNPVCTATNTQFSPQLCSDGAKGAIITWSDIRSGQSQIYAQMLDSNGVSKWANNGVLLSAGALGALPAYGVSDGSGGAIIFYEPSISGGETHIHVQRIDAGGNLMWGNGGIRIDTIGTSRLNNDVDQVVTSDGNGGAYVTWRHYFFGTDEIRVQHIDHNGNLLLGPQGLAVSNNTAVHYSTRVINTNNNTCVLAYEQAGSLLMQRISNTGTKMWGASGVQVTNTMTTITTNNFYLLSTSAKNIAVAWEDQRSGTNIDTYAQKLDTNGVMKWTATGVPVDVSPAFTNLPELAIDNNDGVYLCYGNTLTLVQHLNAAGQLLLGTGKNVATTSGQIAHHMWGDGNNGFVISWEDPYTAALHALYAQHYDSTGTELWRPNGLPVAITGNSGVNTNCRTLGLNSGRAIAAWEDYRNGNRDIYAARFGNNAVLVTGLTAINTCFGDSTQFNDITTSTASTINFWRWNFGDGTAQATIKNPKHKYAATGNYTVTLTLMDNEFNYRVFSQQVTIGSKPTVNLGNDTTICSGSSITLNAGNAGAQFLWSTGATTQTININSAGAYSVKVSNGGCATSDTMVLSLLPLPTAGFTYAANNLNVQFTNASTNAVTYTWKFGDGITDNTSSPLHSYSAAGTYAAKLLATNTCKTDSVIQTITITSGIVVTPPDSCGTAFNVILYPNPVHQFLGLKFFTPTVTSVQMRIVNASGQIMRIYNYPIIKCKDIIQVDMRELAAGNYFVQFFVNGSKIVRPVLKY